MSASTVWLSPLIFSEACNKSVNFCEDFVNWCETNQTKKCKKYRQNFIHAIKVWLLLTDIYKINSSSVTLHGGLP